MDAASRNAIVLSIIIPAHNEEAWISGCLAPLLAGPAPAGGAEVVVAANGCTDATVALARGFEAQARAGGWEFVVLDLPGLGKPAALNAGDAAATGDMRLYLDADVRVGPGVIGGIVAALAAPGRAMPRPGHGSRGRPRR